MGAGAINEKESHIFMVRMINPYGEIYNVMVTILNVCIDI